MAKVRVKEMATAGVVYMLLCIMLLLLSSNMPSNSIEPLEVQQKLSPLPLPSGRHKSVLPVSRHKGGKLSKMISLLESLTVIEHGIKLKWISERISRLSLSWEKSQRDVNRDKHFLFNNPQNILLFPGLVTEYSLYNFSYNAYKGGYLGELIQWSDLLATLHMLGHNVTVLTSSVQLTKRVPLDTTMFDLIFTDYIGLFGLRDSQHFYMYKCRIRVLDSFGTEPLFNFRTTEFQAAKHMDMFNNWMFEDPRQFWTLFPHTPDNSFLGFVVVPPTTLVDADTVKKNQGVIYGKEHWYMDGKESYIKSIGKMVQLHSTFKDGGYSLPKHIINHGVLPANKLQRLLQESKLFVGLGFPYDGPGPFEALANGCAFIQPKFSPPHSGSNTDFFRSKPTTRSLTSQVPYLEQFVGEPYVYTVDIKNGSAVREAVVKIMARDNHKSFIPFEFTQQGMLERVGEYIANQNLCDGLDLARRQLATASSVFKDHTPGDAVDGMLTKETCYWSEHGKSHWWSLDLRRDFALHKIRITNIFEWILAKSWGENFMSPFVITLINSMGNQVASKIFNDNRTFYLWEDISVRARYVRLDSLAYEWPRFFIVCAVEVFGGVSTRPPWPPLSLLWVQKSKLGVSCKDTCMFHNMICEPAHFRALNLPLALAEEFRCSSFKEINTTYVDFLPAWSLVDDNYLGVASGTCITNEHSMLLSCSGHYRNYQRLCPCRKFTKGQIAVPPPL